MLPGSRFYAFLSPFRLRTRKMSPFTADRSGSLLLFGRQEMYRQNNIVELDFDMNAVWRVPCAIFGGWFRQRANGCEMLLPH